MDNLLGIILINYLPTGIAIALSAVLRYRVAALKFHTTIVPAGDCRSLRRPQLERWSKLIRRNRFVVKERWELIASVWFHPQQQTQKKKPTTKSDGRATTGAITLKSITMPVGDRLKPEIDRPLMCRCSGWLQPAGSQEIDGDSPLRREHKQLKPLETSRQGRSTSSAVGRCWAIAVLQVRRKDKLEAAEGEVTASTIRLNRWQSCLQLTGLD